MSKPLSIDTDGVFIDTEDTSTLAGSRADAASELREVVSHQKTVESISPLALEH
jgi:hypothetical protein